MYGDLIEIVGTAPLQRDQLFYGRKVDVQDIPVQSHFPYIWLYVGGFLESSVLTHKKEQQIKIEGEFKPTVDCLCATRRRFVLSIREWVQH